MKREGLMKMMSGKKSYQGAVVSGQYSVVSGYGPLLPASALSKC